MGHVNFFKLWEELMSHPGCLKPQRKGFSSISWWDISTPNAARGQPWSCRRLSSGGVKEMVKKDFTSKMRWRWYIYICIYEYYMSYICINICIFFWYRIYICCSVHISPWHEVNLLSGKLIYPQHGTATLTRRNSLQRAELMTVGSLESLWNRRKVKVKLETTGSFHNVQRLNMKQLDLSW